MEAGVETALLLIDVAQSVVERGGGERLQNGVLVWHDDDVVGVGC